MKISKKVKKIKNNKPKKIKSLKDKLFFKKLDKLDEKYNNLLFNHESTNEDLNYILEITSKISSAKILKFFFDLIDL